MRVILDLPDWQVELLRRAVNVYEPDSVPGIHDVRLTVANAILDATEKERRLPVSPPLFKSGSAMDWHAQHGGGVDD